MGCTLGLRSARRNGFPVRLRLRHVQQVVNVVEFQEPFAPFQTVFPEHGITRHGFIQQRFHLMRIQAQDVHFKETLIEPGNSNGSLAQSSACPDRHIPDVSGAIGIVQPAGPMTKRLCRIIACNLPKIAGSAPLGNCRQSWILTAHSLNGARKLISRFAVVIKIGKGVFEQEQTHRASARCRTWCR